MVLSDDQVSQFVDAGYCFVRQAFPAEVAAKCRSALWTYLVKKHGIVETEPETWSKAPHGRLGISEIFENDDLGAPWPACWSPRLRAAVDVLCGSGRWRPTGCGWWVVHFPGVAKPPWGAEGSWHVDGHGYRHVAQSPEVGLVLIFLFSDVGPRDGGTALVPKSHRTVAEKLLRAGAAGIAGPRLSAAARDSVDLSNIIEATGRAGDVVLAHPFLLHARSKNLGGIVRFMCHPVVPLRQPLRLFPPPPNPTPVERVALGVCRDLEKSGEPVEPFAFPGRRNASPPLSQTRMNTTLKRERPDDELFAAMGFTSFASSQRRRRRA